MMTRNQQPDCEIALVPLRGAVAPDKPAYVDVEHLQIWDGDQASKTSSAPKGRLIKQASTPGYQLVDGRVNEGNHTGTRSAVGYKLGRRKFLAERRKVVSDLSLGCAMFGIVAVIFETEMIMAQVYDKSSLISLVLKSLVSITTIILLALIAFYHILNAQGIEKSNKTHSASLQIFVVDNCIGDWRIAITWPVILQLSVELIICAIHPPPGSFHFVWTNLHADYKTITSVLVPLDLPLALPMFLRLYLIFRVMLLHSKLFTDASSRSIGALNRISFDIKFIIKTLMTICPGAVLLVIMLSMWILASWILRACESYHDVRHKNFLNSMWMIAITFLSVGYGDIVPNTYCGRGVAVSAGVVGSGCTALVVAVLARKLELTRAEKHVHNFMMDNQLSKRLKNSAANVLRETWFIYKYTRLTRKINLSKVRTHQRKFLHAIHSLRKAKLDQRKLNDNANTMIDLAKQHFLHCSLDTSQSAYISQPPALYRQTQTTMQDIIVEMSHRQQQAEKRADRIEESLIRLTAQLNDLPELISNHFKAQKLLNNKR